MPKNSARCRLPAFAIKAGAFIYLRTNPCPKIRALNQGKKLRITEGVCEAAALSRRRMRPFSAPSSVRMKSGADKRGLLSPSAALYV